MKRVLLFVVLGMVITSNAYAQNWLKLGNGLNRTVRSMYADTASGLLYVGGEFTHSGNLPLNYVGSWNGNNWDSLGHGSTGKEPTYSITKYQGTILAGSDFLNNLENTFAQWNGNQWLPYKFSVNESTDAFAQKDTVLYFGGTFDSVDNKPVNYVCSWDGKNIHAINLNVPWAYVNTLQFYHNNLYIGGNFEDDSISDLGVYDGTSILPVGEGIIGHVNDEIYSMTVYNDELYVAGELSKAEGDAGDNIMKWDGETWSDVGGGINGSVYYITVHNNILYACGYFTEAGGQTVSDIAQWDGNSWSSLGPEVFSGLLTRIAFLNNDMYVGGYFTKIDTTTFNCIAKYNHLLTAAKIINPLNNISIFPNPTSNVIQLSNLPSQSSIFQYSIINILGQTKQNNALAPNNTSGSINVSTLPDGVYFIRLTGSKGVVWSGKFVKQ